MQREQIREMYDVESSHWWFWGKRLLMRRLLAEHLARPDRRILDIGCGAGANAFELSSFGRVTASDRSLDALAFVRSRGISDVVAAEAPEMPFADASFDIVTAYDVVEHVSDDCRFVTELARVLAPGGALAIHVPAWPSLWSSHDEALEHKKRYTRRGLLQLLGTTGLEIVSSRAERADLAAVAPPLNSLLRGIYRIEAAMAASTGLPIGVSLAAIATKPHSQAERRENVR
jgi:ubiquinone/menaquinone biosynthesis C-methylase UbiE